MAVLIPEQTNRVRELAPEKDYVAAGQAWDWEAGYASVGGRARRILSLGGQALVDELLTDPIASGAIRTIKQGVLAQGMQITSTVVIDPDESAEDLTKDDIDTAFRVEAHCERSWRAMQAKTSGLDLLWRMLGMIEYRTMLAEMVVQDPIPTTGPDAGLYLLDHVTVKDPGTWSFARDAYGNVQGIRASVIRETRRDDGSRASVYADEILDRRKFLISAWAPQASNPYGEGVMSQVYGPLNFKIQVWPLLYKYLRLFGVPTVWAQTPENSQDRHLLGPDGQPLKDDQGNVLPKINPQSAMAKEIEVMLSGGHVLVGPSGSNLSFLNPPGEGEAFQFVLEMLDRAIVYAIHQSATQSAGTKRGNGTDPAFRQDLLALIIGYGKWVLSEMLHRDLWRVLVRYNFGEAIANRFTPMVSFGMTSPEDFSRNANAITRLYAAGVLTEAERSDALRFLGLNWGRSRRRDRPANVSSDPGPGRQAINVVKPVAA